MKQDKNVQLKKNELFNPEHLVQEWQSIVKQTLPFVSLVYHLSSPLQVCEIQLSSPHPPRGCMHGKIAVRDAHLLPLKYPLDTAYVF